MTIAIPMTAQQAAAAIQQCISTHGGPYSSWYIGITADPETRVYGFHCVNRYSADHKVCLCVNEAAARSVEQHFLAKGCDGGDGGGINPRYVYVYKKKATTRER